MDATIRTIKQLEDVAEQLKRHSKMQREEASRMEARSEAFREAAEMLRNNCHRELNQCDDTAKVACDRPSGASQPMSRG